MKRTTFASVASALALVALLGCSRHHNSPPAAAASDPCTSAADVCTGGDVTVFDVSSQAYSAPLPQLAGDDLDRFNRGDLELFEPPFVSGASPLRGGLGPQYNNTSCKGCHVNVGRGLPTFDDGLGSELLVLTSVASGGQPEEPGGPIPAPGVGLQVQDHAVFGTKPTASAKLTWTEEPHTFGDGTVYSLRRPVVTVTLPDGSALPANVLTSVRQAAPVFGLGLLEAVSDDSITALATAPGKIAGVVNTTWSVEAKAPAVGRFGRKAARPSVREQVGKALYFDIGITNALFPDPAGAAAKISDDDFATLVFYVENLAVPARRNLDDPDVQHGEALFHSVGCIGCHQPDMQTGASQVAAFANQTIHPYSDLLLHDMGPDLADGRPEFTATGSQWRTPTLWGIGLVQTVRPYASYLHDGRARTLEEAVLWHGGQALPYREAFRNLPAADRQALVKFLGSL